MKQIIMRKPLDEQLTWQELTEYTADKIGRMRRSDFDREDFVKWMLKRKPRGYLFDSTLIYLAYRITQNLNDDNDYFIVISGLEGTGKSLLATQLCSLVDLNFGIAEICLNSNEYIGNLDKKDQKSSLQLDEAGLDLFSRQAMTRKNIDLVQLFMVMRQLRIFTCLCIPNFHLLDSYVKDHRVDVLIQIKKRGKYRAFYGEAIRKIVKEGTKSKQVLGIKVPVGYFWDGGWRKLFPLNMNEEEYKEKKDKHVHRFIREVQKKPLYMKLGELSMKIGISHETLRRKLHQGLIPHTKVGSNYFVPRDDAEKMIREGIS